MLEPHKHTKLKDNIYMQRACRYPLKLSVTREDLFISKVHCRTPTFFSCSAGESLDGVFWWWCLPDYFPITGHTVTLRREKRDFETAEVSNTTGVLQKLHPAPSITYQELCHILTAYLWWIKTVKGVSATEIETWVNIFCFSFLISWLEIIFICV